MGSRYNCRPIVGSIVEGVYAFQVDIFRLFVGYIECSASARSKSEAVQDG